MLNYLDRAYRDYLKEEPVAGRSPDEYFSSRAPYLRYIVRDCFPKNRDAVILDLGCGSGGLIHVARIAGYNNISGVDRSEQQVEKSRMLGVAGIQQRDLIDTIRTLQSNALDLVITLDVLEHLSKEAICRLCDEVHRVLKRGGRWIIHAPNAESPLFGAVRYGDFTHEIAFTSRSIAQVMAMAGFSSVIVREDVPIPHGLLSSIRWLLWKLMTLPLRAFYIVETGAMNGNFILSQNLLAVVIK